MANAAIGAPVKTVIISLHATSGEFVEIHKTCKSSKNILPSSTDRLHCRSLLAQNRRRQQQATIEIIVYYDLIGNNIQKEEHLLNLISANAQCFYQKPRLIKLVP